MTDYLKPHDVFVNQTMLTCIGNKRKLIKNIEDVVNEVKDILNKDKLNMLDAFTGSTVVARALSSHAKELHVNDLENYSYLMASCYLNKPTKKNMEKIKNHIDKMNKLAEEGPFVEDGIIGRLYAPKDTEDIKEGERCFYTAENGKIIDTLRKYIEDEVESGLKTYCLVPLLNKASIHTNTGGVFKGFYKDNNIGKFGGKKETNLSRIKGEIRLDMPFWNENKYKVTCHKEDINDLIGKLKDDLDLIYLDPPYNQHPYGSNYFMLNVIAKNEDPGELSRVSGIPKDWNKSNYNYYERAINSMRDLLKDSLSKSKYVLLSYNNEGIIQEKDWEDLFSDYDVKKYEIKYNAYRASRNLKDRNDKVVERMYLIKLK